MSTVELVYDYFEDHVRASAVIAERRPLALGLLGFLIGGLSLFVAQALAGRLLVFSFSPVSMALALLWQVAGGFLLTAALHLILEMGGVKGSAGALFVQLGLSDLSWAAAVPLILLSRLAAPGSSLLPTALFGLVGFWSLFLKARGLQDNYHIASGRAWVALGLPYLAVAGVLVLAVALSALAVALQLFRLFH